jgi:hypothetical protein
MNLKINASILSAVILSCVLAVGANGQIGIPDARLTVKVVDDDGSPVSGANVAFFFCKEFDGNAVAKFEQVTGFDGLATGEGATEGRFTINVSKPGYYISGAPMPEFRDTVGGRWQPWGATVSTVLRKVGDPVPMYVRKFGSEIPEVGTQCGFDMLEGDWVAPYGQGKVSDFTVTLSRRYGGWRDFEVQAEIVFPDKYDGIQAVDLPKEFSYSAFRWPRLAPTVGYQPSFVAINAWYPKDSGKTAVRSDNGAQNYYFRIRTVVQDGQIISALYGKIHGGIAVEPRGAKLCVIGFNYYLNPVSLDRNMESDPARNLAPKVRSFDQPLEP